MRWGRPRPEDDREATPPVDDYKKVRRLSMNISIITEEKEEKIFVEDIHDIAGESHKHWLDVIKHYKPRGIMCLLDHAIDDTDDPTKSTLTGNIEALNFIANNILSKPDGLFSRLGLSHRDHIQAFNNLKVFAVLVNKRDLWELEGFTRNNILDKYYAQLDRIRTLFETDHTRSYTEASICSICDKDDDNFTEYKLDNMSFLLDFFDKMIAMD